MSIESRISHDVGLFARLLKTACNVHPGLQQAGLATAVRYALDAEAARPAAIPPMPRAQPVTVSPDRERRAIEFVERHGTPMFAHELVVFAEQELSGMLSDPKECLVHFNTPELVKELERRRLSGQAVVIPATLIPPPPAAPAPPMTATEVKERFREKMDGLQDAARRMLAKDPPPMTAKDCIAPGERLDEYRNRLAKQQAEAEAVRAVAVPARRVDIENHVLCAVHGATSVKDAADAIMKLVMAPIPAVPPLHRDEIANVILDHVSSAGPITHRTTLATRSAADEIMKLVEVSR